MIIFKKALAIATDNGTNQHVQSAVLQLGF